MLWVMVYFVDVCSWISSARRALASRIVGKFGKKDKKMNLMINLHDFARSYPATEIKDKDDPILMRHYMAAKDPDGILRMGHIITYLSVQDWCDMNGWKLVNHYAGTSRPALKSEKNEMVLYQVSDLFCGCACHR